VLYYYTNNCAKVAKHFYLSAKATHPAPVALSGRLGFVYDAFSLSKPNALLHTVFVPKSVCRSFGSFWNKNTLVLQACQKPIIEDYLDFLH